MKLTTKAKIITTTALTTIITGGSVITYYQMKNLNNTNDRLKMELENAKCGTQSKYVNKSTIYKDLVEINKKNINLIVYEAHSESYQKTLSDSKFIESKVTLTTSYSYNATIDLRGVYICEVDNNYLVVVDLNQIQLKEISIAPMTINNDLNVFNRWKGATISDMTSTVIKQATSDIEIKVHDDFANKKDLIETKAKAKIDAIYKGLPVKIIYTNGGVDK